MKNIYNKLKNIIELIGIMWKLLVMEVRALVTEIHKAVMDVQNSDSKLLALWFKLAGLAGNINSMVSRLVKACLILYV